MTPSGANPSSLNQANCPAESAPIAGWANSVRRSDSSCAVRVASSKAGGGNTTRPSVSAPEVSRLALSYAARTGGTARAASRPMPTYWLPWPAKTAAAFVPAGTPERR